MFIGLSGFAGVGKDSVANVLQQKGFAVIGFADPLKRFILEVFKFDSEDVWGDSERRYKEYLKYPRDNSMGGPSFLTPRYALESLGTNWGRDCYQQTWSDYAIHAAQQVLDGKRYVRENGLYDAVYPHKGVCISDCRFLNEMEAVRSNGGKLIRIVRPLHQKPISNAPSETEQLKVPDNYFDAILDNDGSLEDLPRKVDEILERWC